MTELVMRKREGRAGEIGLFVDTEVFEEDFQHIKLGAEVNVKATTPRSLRQLKFAWGLATKIASGCDWVDSKEDCMDFMLIEAKHFRRIFDPLRNVAILKPKPTNFGAMDGTEYTRLLKRLVHIAVTVMIPGMDDAAMIAEVEAMVGPDLAASAPEPAKPQRATRAKKTNPEPVSQAEGGDESAGPDTAASNPQGAGPRPSPTNEAEYLIAARQWIAKQTDHPKALDYLDSTPQIELRAACKLSVGANKMIRRELAEHFEKLKGKTDVKDQATA